MTKDEIKKEANDEFAKSTLQLAEDLIEEANFSNTSTEDRTKHLIKRLGVHQLVLANRQKCTNVLLVVLSLIMAVAAVFTIVTYFAKH